MGQADHDRFEPINNCLRKCTQDKCENTKILRHFWLRFIYSLLSSIVFEWFFLFDWRSAEGLQSVVKESMKVSLGCTQYDYWVDVRLKGTRLNMRVCNYSIQSVINIILTLNIKVCFISLACAERNQINQFRDVFYIAQINRLF